MAGFGMKWTTHPRSPNRADSQGNHTLDRLSLNFAASGLEPSASIGLFVVPGVAGTCWGKSSFLGYILALLPSGRSNRGVGSRPVEIVPAL